ncbi:MAG: hypothetical protein ACLU6Y_04595 [Ruminococcus sp.]
MNEIVHRVFKSRAFSGRVAIVDIGWFGNMQSNIELLASKIKYLQMYTDIMWRWHQMENIKNI